MMIVTTLFLISYLSIIDGQYLQMLQTVQSTINHNTATLSIMLQEILRRLPKDQNIAALREVAFGKRTKQSSDDYRWPSVAVDGNLNSFSRTQVEHSPYWEVDLGRDYLIKRIDIFNRKDCCGDRLHDLYITTGPAHNQMYPCAYYKGPGRTGEHLVFKCHHSKYARYVKLVIKGKESLTLAEVKVYAQDD